MTKFLTAPIMYGLLAIIAALGIFATVQTLRLSDEKAEHQTALAGHAKVLQNLAELTAKAESEYRALEKSGEEATTAARSARDEELSDALTKNAALAADVAAGKRRLREVWAGQSRPAPGMPNPDAADRAGVSNAELQGAAVERIAGIGDSCDARVRFLLKREQAWQDLRSK